MQIMFKREKYQYNFDVSSGGQCTLSLIKTNERIVFPVQ